MLRDWGEQEGGVTTATPHWLPGDNPLRVLPPPKEEPQAVLLGVSPFIVVARDSTEDIVCGRGEKKKNVFVDLISPEHFMVSNPFVPQRKFRNSSMLSREQ